jgi:hypothetical protein
MFLHGPQTLEDEGDILFEMSGSISWLLIVTAQNSGTV